MTEPVTEELDALNLDFTPTLACEERRHPLNQDGHNATEPASWIVELTHDTSTSHTVDDTTFALRRLVCRSRVIYLRGRLADTIWCAGCGKQGTLADWFRIVGPIEGTA